MIRRFVLGALLALLVSPASASAAATKTFSSKSIGVSFRYPASWRLTATPAGAVKQITAFSSTSLYSIMVSAYPIKPGKTIAGTLRRYVKYTSTLDGPAAVRYRWTATTFAGRHAESAVTYPATEGGVQTAIGLYVVGSRSHIYAITIQTRGRTLPRSVNGFPAVYRQIFRTWKFV